MNPVCWPTGSLILTEERRFSPLSVEAYARDVRAFLLFLTDHLGEEPNGRALAALEPQDLRAYMAHRRQGDDPLKDRSLSRALAAIRGFFRWMERRRGIANARISLVRGPRLKATLPRPVSEDAANAPDRRGGTGFGDAMDQCARRGVDHSSICSRSAESAKRSL
ncbi:MAG: site-specific integrase [Alphaproteobacteria bacterium]